MEDLFKAFAEELEQRKLKKSGPTPEINKEVLVKALMDSGYYQSARDLHIWDTKDIDACRMEESLAKGMFDSPEAKAAQAKMNRQTERSRAENEKQRRTPGYGLKDVKNKKSIPKEELDAIEQRGNKDSRSFEQKTIDAAIDRRDKKKVLDKNPLPAASDSKVITRKK